ncbi:hypothetical protein RI367_000502 [Sorochytrium milnesiophthora]
MSLPAIPASWEEWQTLLQSVWDKLTSEHGKTVVVPTLIGTLTVLYVARRVRKSTRVPKELAHLPRIPISAMFRSLFTKGGGFIGRQEMLHKACDDWCNRHGIQQKGSRRQMNLVWLFGTWGFATSNPKHVQKIVSDLETFPKLLLPPSLAPISNKLLGTNVVISNGDVWKKHRKIAHPAFHKRWSSDVFGQVTRVFMQELDKHLGESMEPQKWMQRLTLDALSTAAFAESFDALRFPDSDLVHTYDAVMESLTDRRQRIIPFFQHLPLPSVRQASARVDKFNKYIMDIIAKRTVEVQARRLAGEGHADDEADGRNRDLLTRMIEANLDDPTFTKEDLRGNVVIFFIAGHDTTSNALSVALFFMGLHKDIQNKARQEVIDLMGDVDPTTPAAEFPCPTTDEQAQLTYLTYIIKESLRLYPSVGALGFRRTTRPVELEPGLVLPANTRLHVDIVRLQRDPFVWGDDALEFKPDRWRDTSFLTGNGKQGKKTTTIDSSENSQSLTGSVPMMPAQHDYAWMPFGAGQRICLGQGFSILEQRVILAMILLRYEWEVIGDQDALNGKIVPCDGALMHPTNVQLRFRLRGA